MRNPPIKLEGPLRQELVFVAAHLATIASEALRALQPLHAVLPLKHLPRTNLDRLIASLVILEGLGDSEQRAQARTLREHLEKLKLA